MNKNNFTFFIILIVLTFWRCDKKEIQPEFNPIPHFEYSVSNNGINPCVISLKGEPEKNEVYNWNFNNEYIGSGDSISYEIKEEGYHTIVLTLTNVSNVLYSDTSFKFLILGKEFLKADTIASNDFSCYSFNYDSISFYFEHNKFVDNGFIKNPLFHPIGDPDVGVENKILYALIDRNYEYDINNEKLSGWGYWIYDVEWTTDKIEMDFNVKFYIEIKENCISSVIACNF